MNETYITEHQVRRADELVSWTLRERLRFLWYRLRLTVQEMNEDIRGMILLDQPSACASKAGSGRAGP